MYQALNCLPTSYTHCILLRVFLHHSQRTMMCMILRNESERPMWDRHTQRKKQQPRAAQQLTSTLHLRPHVPKISSFSQFINVIDTLSPSQSLSHTHADLQMLLPTLKPASCVSWLVPSLSFLLAPHMLCAAFVWASFDKSESITMRGCSPAKYSLQSALAGFLQICEYLNKDKIRCKQINQGTEEGRRHLPFHTLLHQFTWGRLFQDSFSWNVWGEYVVGLWYKMSGNITSLSSKWICATLHLSVVIVYCVMLLNWKIKH